MLELAKELPGDKKIILGFRDEQYLTEELNAYGDVYVATEMEAPGRKEMYWTPSGRTDFGAM